MGATRKTRQQFIEEAQQLYMQGEDKVSYGHALDAHETFARAGVCATIALAMAPAKAPAKKTTRQQAPKSA